jgi:hypothetical protein
VAGWIRVVAGFGALAVAAPWATGPAAASVPPTDFCTAVAPGVTAGTIESPALVELSGLTASRAFPGVLWANNDSGDSARLFAISDTGEALGTYAVEGADATDWEDLAIGPGPDGAPELYIADIGDNDAARSEVTVYRVPEPATRPDGSDATLTGADALVLTYASGAEDAEALFVDPVSGDLFIITKQLLGNSRILKASASALVPGAPIVMAEVGSLQIGLTAPYDTSQPLSLPSTMVTAADISPDGAHVLVRTYQQVLAFERAADQTVEQALAGEPCEAPQVGEPQGEAIAFAADDSAYFTASEVQLAGAANATLSRFDIAAPAPPTPTTTSTPTSTVPPATTEPLTTTSASTAPVTTAGSTTTASPSASTTTAEVTTTATPGSSGSSAGWWIAGAVVVVLALVGAIVVRRRAGAVGDQRPR